LRQTLGDFGKQHGKITHEFQPTNPMAFETKMLVWKTLKKNQ